MSVSYTPPAPKPVPPKRYYGGGKAGHGNYFYRHFHTTQRVRNEPYNAFTYAHGGDLVLVGTILGPVYLDYMIFESNAYTSGTTHYAVTFEVRDLNDNVITTHNRQLISGAPREEINFKSGALSHIGKEGFYSEGIKLYMGVVTNTSSTSYLDNIRFKVSGYLLDDFEGDNGSAS